MRARLLSANHPHGAMGFGEPVELDKMRIMQEGDGNPLFRIPMTILSGTESPQIDINAWRTGSSHVLRVDRISSVP